MTTGDTRHARQSGRDWFWNPIARVLLIALMILALTLLFIDGVGVPECAPDAWRLLC